MLRVYFIDDEGRVCTIEARSMASAIYDVKCDPDVQRLGEALTDEDVLLVSPPRGPVCDGGLRINQGRRPCSSRR